MAYECLSIVQDFRDEIDGEGRCCLHSIQKAEFLQGTSRVGLSKFEIDIGNDNIISQSWFDLHIYFLLQKIIGTSSRPILPIVGWPVG